MTADDPGRGTLGATGRPLSRVLVELSTTAGERVSLDELAVALADRSYGALLILFAAPNLLPLPPGASTIFGVPLILIAAQLVIGRTRIWLPRFVRDRSIDAATFGNIARRLEPFLQRFERLARPRYWPASRVVADRFVGVVALVMALVLTLPIPLGNWLPAVAIIIISLGLAERDGVWVGVGTLIAAAAIGIVVAVVATIGLAAESVFF